MCKEVSSRKLKKEHNGDGFIPKYEVSCIELRVAIYKLLLSQYHCHQTDFRNKSKKKVYFELLKLIYFGRC